MSKKHANAIASNRQSSSNESSENTRNEHPQQQEGVITKTAEELSQEYLTDLQRLQADFANYKKRQQESQKELAGYLIEKLVMEITPVLDNFQMATAHVPAEAANSPWVTGIQYIEKQLEKVLADNGMTIIEAHKGDVFDPSIHEAVSEEKKNDPEDSASEGDGGKPQEVHIQKVARMLQKGYRIGGKVIRPVKVVVG
jgi:molecular chaperone GrpE